MNISLVVVAAVVSLSGKGGTGRVFFLSLLLLWLVVGNHVDVVFLLCFMYAVLQY
jgi:hypothetical protein